GARHALGTGVWQRARRGRLPSPRERSERWGGVGGGGRLAHGRAPNATLPTAPLRSATELGHARVRNFRAAEVGYTQLRLGGSPPVEWRGSRFTASSTSHLGRFGARHRPHPSTPRPCRDPLRP